MAFTKVGTLIAGDTITAAGINAGFVANQTWSPTMLNLTVGNGTIVAKYAMAGRTYTFKWEFTFGSTSALAASSPTVSLPVAPADGKEINNLGCTMFDVSAGGYYDGKALGSGLTFTPCVMNAASTYVLKTGVTSAIPVLPAVGDVLSVSGSYEGVS